MNKLFHYLRYLGIPFSVAAMYYIYYGSIVRKGNFLEDVGTGVLCMGIALAFGSMGDIKKVSKSEHRLFTNPKKYKSQLRKLTILGFVTLVICLLFVSMKWSANEEMGRQYYNLGLNLFPNVVAMFFSVKQMQDKKQYWDLENSTTELAQSGE